MNIMKYAKIDAFKSVSCFSFLNQTNHVLALKKKKCTLTEESSQQSLLICGSVINWCTTKNPELLASLKSKAKHPKLWFIILSGLNNPPSQESWNEIHHGQLR